MTLTTILPTLRRSIPDPLRASRWPAHTKASTTDLTIAGVSMLRLAELCDTPCVHTGNAMLPEERRALARAQDAGVVVVRISAVLQNFDAERVVLIDGCLDNVPAIWEETRLIGRTSTAKATTAVILSGESHEVASTGRHVVTLPADLHEGDLLVVPCAGMVTLREVRPRPLRTSYPTEARDRELPEPVWLGTLA